MSLKLRQIKYSLTTDSENLSNAYCISSELDPSLSNGYRVVFEREVPIEIRNYNSDEPVR
jgi:hypothetical protein